MIEAVEVRGFRTVKDVRLEPGPVTALIGEPDSGKSNLLVAIWKLLHQDAPVEEPTGATLTLIPGAVPEVVFFAAAERPRGLMLIDQVRTWLDEGRRHTVVLIEEPELYLRPHVQRTLYRLLRELAANGNQVIYATHEPTFLNVGRLEEIALLDRSPAGDTRVRRPHAIPHHDEFRALSEFDAERSELLLSRAAVLVEGRTEKLVFPYFFRALGYEVDDEAISIVECGGKPNIPIIAEVCNLIDLPYLVVHDRDALPGRQPNQGEQLLNDAILAIAGPERTIELARDFEAVAKLHGHRHKPAHALKWFGSAGEVPVPDQLADVVHRAIALARAG